MNKMLLPLGRRAQFATPLLGRLGGLGFWGPTCLFAVILGLTAWIGHGQKADRPSKPKLAVAIKPQHLADALRAQITAEREVYTQVIVQRLQDQEKLLKASSRWEQDKALPTPCQMLRLAAEAVGAKGVEFSYTLRSPTPVSPRNAVETDVEKKGLEFVTSRPDLTYTAEELLGGRWYFTAVYPDVAVHQSCVTCHNQLNASEKKDFKLGDVMGALVIRIALEL
jgi:hypothetical protein